MTASTAFETARLVSSHTPAALQLVSAYVAVVQPSKVGPLMEHLRQALPLASLHHLKRVRKAPQQPHTEVLLCALRDVGQQHQHQHQQQSSQQQQSPQKQGGAPQSQQGAPSNQPQHPTPPAAEGAAAGAVQQQDTQHHQQQQQQQQQAEQQQQEQYPSGLPPSTTSILAQVQAQVTLQQVPGCPPDNRQQWQDWTKFWPMSWRCPAGAAEQQDGQPPSPSDQQYFTQHMAAVAAASAAAGGSNVARIVDPITGEVLAECVDGSCQHPLDHAAMRAIEAVADRDRRLWPFNGFAHSGRHAEAPDAGGYLATPTVHPVCSPRALTEGDGHHANAFAQQQQQDQQHQIRQQHDGAEVALQQQQAVAGLPPCKKHKAVDVGTTAAAVPAAAVPQHADGTAGSSKCNSSTPAEAAHAAAAAAAAAQGAPSNGNNGTSAPATAAAAAAAVDAAAGNGRTDWSRKPYLCTGYDCFLAAEPCIMCSMAMVHSRLARVVYCRADRQYGALGGKLRLHAQRSLNHHYLVYHMPTKGEQHQHQQ